ncbi:hypothetical protein F4803DRAFT_141738 [Xylaria telfairii]|nr:hypothetical protein F4803DRAFT_141738 [Xylaria telfairii]
MASRPNDENDDPDMAQLAAAPEDIVRAVLIALCQNAKQEQKALAHFKKLQQLRSEQLRHDDNTATSSTATPHGSNGISNGAGGISGGDPTKRRAASEIRICDQCQQAFSEDDNPPDACSYHPGSLDIIDDASTWDDWDDACFGDQDTEQNREEYPQGFTWDCCNERGDSPGCTRESHFAEHTRPYRGGMMGHTIVTDE